MPNSWLIFWLCVYFIICFVLGYIGVIHHQIFGQKKEATKRRIDFFVGSSKILWLGTGAHVFYPSIWEAEAGVLGQHYVYIKVQG